MVDPQARTFAEDRARKTYILYRGHLFTTESERAVLPDGSEGLGRDLFSRIVYGSRVTMCVGLIGVLISFWLGITDRRAFGLCRRQLDNLIMRWSEIEMSLPSFYFLLALAAVIPSGSARWRHFL